MKRILIATDGSETSKAAVRHGLGLVRALGGEAIVVRISGKPAHIVVMGVDLTALPPEVRAEIHRHIEQHFAWVREEAAAQGVTVETVNVESEHPWKGILETAEAQGADLIVMATHGRRGRGSLLIGSETQHVLLQSRVPVLVLR